MTSAKIHHVCKGTLQTRWPDCQQMCHDASKSPPCPICNPEQMRGAMQRLHHQLRITIDQYNTATYNAVTAQ